jgi:hypothetical protein
LALVFEVEMVEVEIVTHDVVRAVGFGSRWDGGVKVVRDWEVQAGARIG